MTVLRYAIVKNNLVENVILWDSDEYPDFEKQIDGVLIAVQSEAVVSPGDTYDGKSFTPQTPPPTPDIPVSDDVIQLMASLVQKNILTSTDISDQFDSDVAQQVTDAVNPPE